MLPKISNPLFSPIYMHDYLGIPFANSKLIHPSEKNELSHSIQSEIQVLGGPPVYNR